MSDVQRTRILDAAIGLMADKGARGMSMRSLAAGCGLNVATLYHYFPSKIDLVRAAIAHGRVESLLERPFPEGLPGTVEQRLGALLDHLCVAVTADAALWRALLAEAIHGDDEVLEPVLEMSAAFEGALAHWITDLIPDAPGLHAPAVVRPLRHGFYGVLVEYLPQADDGRTAMRAEVRELATTFARIAQAPTTEDDSF